MGPWGCKESDLTEGLTLLLIAKKLKKKSDIITGPNNGTAESPGFYQAFFLRLCKRIYKFHFLWKLLACGNKWLNLVHA